MVDERAQAISVANCYSVLVDDMFPGFKDYLAKHVTLKWFGQYIKGRKNVADFMLSDKRKSIHKFHKIMPTSNITWKKSYRRKRQSSDQNTDVKEAEGDIYTSNCSRQEASCETEMPTTHEKTKSFKRFKRYQESDAEDTDLMQKNCDRCDSLNKTRMNVSTVCNYADDHVCKNRNDTNATTDLNDGCYDLNEGDLRNLFELEITSETVEEIQNINRIKLKEEMAPTIRVINRERDQEDRPVAVAETGTTKYLEAIGKISLSYVDMPEDSTFGHYWPRCIKTWKQTCKVQIAYSILTVGNSSKTAKKNDVNVHSSHPTMVQRDVEEKEKNTEKDMETQERNTKRDTETKNKLPCIEEFIRANNTLIPDVDYFGGYLKPVNFFDDRKEFIETFEAQIKQDNPGMHSSVRYEGDKLIFVYPNKASFHVTYQIHMIAYTKLKSKKIQKEVKGKEIEK
ncbi:hypothetical protein DMN91_003726 [Ooceraea biroi]|uniref:Uncharacterized protein n=1 Tax=Ooceraea biroi TaxID=2015173 RepID=A0A026W3I2_OOCBI|nr:uncharacterized protein LOC105283580 [Ooceraea biroi]EZA50607.1 hypothetical protein X777_10958 [Ooceraea biroi]RLU23521.1 hypothetical protein DMN91_003726 [Ooceraea biroi]